MVVNISYYINIGEQRKHTKRSKAMDYDSMVYESATRANLGESGTVKYGKTYAEYELDFHVHVFPASLFESGWTGYKRILDYGQAIAKSNKVRIYDDETIKVKHGRKWFKLDCFVASYVAQPCIYV